MKKIYKLLVVFTLLALFFLSKNIVEATGLENGIEIKKIVTDDEENEIETVWATAGVIKDEYLDKYTNVENAIGIVAGKYFTNLNSDIEKSDLESVLNAYGIAHPITYHTEKDGYLATGDYLISSEGNTYTIVVYGDADGNGTIGANTDYQMIIEAFTNKNYSIDDYKKIALDINMDGILDVSDIMNCIDKFHGKDEERFANNGTGTLVTKDPFKLASSSTDIPSDKITVRIANSTLTVGENTKIEITPSTYSQSATYTPRKTGIVEVSSDGTVTAIGVGSTQIVVKINGYDSEMELNVTVSESYVHVEEVGLEINNSLLNVGDTVQLIKTITPSNATITKIEYSSDNTSVATVDQNGLITGVGDGTANITMKVTHNDGTSSATVSVKVTSEIKVNRITVVGATTVAKGATTQINATVEPENATNKNLKWTSSNSTVATVDSNGVVTGVSVGEATITVSTTDGSNISNDHNITVIE